jgi:uncharacterized membrane protein YfcA
MLAGIPIAELAGLALALVVAGALSGVLAGLFGVGGGAILVPVLYQLFAVIGVPDEVRMHLAVGTSLAIIIPTSIRSFRSHLAKKAVDMEILKQWAVPVFLGVVAGSFLAAVVSAQTLRGVFAVIAGITGLKLLIGRDDWRFSDHMPGLAGMTGYGLGIGVLSALMGIGGGLISNMIMNLHNRPIHRAVATSSGLGVIISIPGMIGYVIGGWSKGNPLAEGVLPPLSLGYVSLIGALLVIPTSVWLAPMGVKLAHGFTKRQLEIAFGIFLTLVAMRFGWSLLF